MAFDKLLAKMVTADLQICTLLYVQKSSLQKELHVMTAVNNEKNVHDMFHYSVYNTIGLKKILGIHESPRTVIL